MKRFDPTEVHRTCPKCGFSPDFESRKPDVPLRSVFGVQFRHTLSGHLALICMRCGWEDYRLPLDAPEEA